MKRTAFISLCLLLVLGSAFTEEAALVPENNIRFTLAPSFGFQAQEWDWTNVAADKVMLFGAGVGIEYAPADWINVQALWFPGINAWSQIEGGNYGRFSDVFVGIKAAILAGETALVEAEKFKNIRFTAALGLKIPLPKTPDSVREPDQHLWGSAARLYFDYTFSSLFTLNAFAEGIYYPRQYADTPNFSPVVVEHYMDLNGELEGRFRYPVEKAGIILYWGLPIGLFVSPVYNAEDPAAADRQMRFQAGAYFGVGFTRIPLELFVKYNAPITGLNDQPVHRISLSARYLLNIGRP